MNIIFQIDGGRGKCVAATAVCMAIRAQYPKDKLIVVSGYPEVFLCNPYVDKALNFNNLSYFYEDHIEGQEIKTFLHDPYLATDFISRKGHLVKVWCEMNGIPYTGEQPRLFVNTREQTLFGNQLMSILGNPQK